MIREFNQQWNKDYVRKTAETLHDQADRRKSVEKNDQRSVLSFEKDKKVVTFFKSSIIGHSDLAKVQEDLYGNKLGMLKQECKTRCLPHTIADYL